MLTFVTDWLNLLLRWAHLVAAIGWIGTSFYFIALDLSLKKRKKMNAGVMGTAWEVHGGGFYHVEKYLNAPDSLPDDLIWFKWEAYLTWVTGFALMVVQFYFNANIWLIDPQVMVLETWQAIALSAGSLLAGWLVYDAICRSPVGRNTPVLAAAVFVLILAAAWGYTHVFSSRVALVHTGAFIGTLMAVNVFGIIIPNQKKITVSLIAGEKPDPKFGVIGKQRSTHNTYLTLPVLVLMVSGHYPMLTGHPHAWLLVGLIVVGGAMTRHFLVRHEVGDPLAKIAWTLPVIGLALAVAIWMTLPKSQLAGVAVSDAEVVEITQKHCANCHAAKPPHESFDEPPKGIILETAADLKKFSPLVKAQSVDTQIMPLGNETGMTDEERKKLGAWLAQK